MLLTGHMAPDAEEALNPVAVHLTLLMDPGEYRSFWCCKMMQTFFLCYSVDIPRGRENSVN